MKEGWCDMDARRAVSEIFHAAVKAVDPYESVKSRVDSVVSAYHRGRHDRLVPVGIGKAAGPMTMNRHCRLMAP